MELTVQFLKDMLEEKSIKPSVQRLSILKYVMESKSHPCVDDIYKELVPTIPTLSKTTVYNTLKQLTERGLLVALTIDETKVQYDFYEQSHAHFMCVKCGHIEDVFLDNSVFNLTKIDTMDVMEAQIYLKGFCKNCKQRGDS